MKPGIVAKIARAELLAAMTEQVTNPHVTNPNPNRDQP